MPDIIQIQSGSKVGIQSGSKVGIVFGGVKGDPGEPGSDGSRSWTYVHVQDAPEAQWEIQHDLNGYPSITTVDEHGLEIKGSVSYMNSNVVLVMFNKPLTGQAYFS